MDKAVLTNKEDEIYSIVTGLKGTMEDKAKQLIDRGIYDEYLQIHSHYADNADKNIESLKRGLFIQWLAMIEPSCFTGVNDLDIKSERLIIKVVDSLITTDNLDYELKWMLNYYMTWDWVFDRFSEFKGLQDWIKNRIETELPEKVDRQEMMRRGRMGRYWNSLNRFAE